MSNIYKNVTELIGRTPLVEVEKIEKRFKEVLKIVSHIR